MDPNACLRRIASADRYSSAECRNACQDLAGWLARGGFEPCWKDHPLGTKRYRKWSGFTAVNTAEERA